MSWVNSGTDITRVCGPRPTPRPAITGPRWCDTRPAGSGAVQADRSSGAVGGRPAAVLHQETRRDGELVGPPPNDRHGQYLPGQVGAGQVGAGRVGALGGVFLLQVHVRDRAAVFAAAVSASSVSVSTSSRVLRRGAS